MLLIYMAQIPTPTLEQIGWFLLGFLVGLPAPYWYAQERIRGFTRSVLKRIPYEPPPGQHKEEALEEAVSQDKKGEQDGQTESDN